MNIKRIVPHDDSVLVKDYSDLMEKMPPDVVIVEDMDGTYRFQPNKLIQWLVSQRGVDLNRMCMAYGQGRFTLEEYMEFYRGMGYSLDGFCEIFADKLWSREKL